MGTIAQKLTYLDGTKQALKESINNIGGDITSETTFREYAQELDNIYDNLPKTTGESSNLSLTTIKGKMNTTIKGDTSQNGTPTPDTPIDIEVVTGTQEVKVENKNLCTEMEQGDVSTSTGEASSYQPTTSGFIRSKDYIPVKPSEVITVSYKNTATSSIQIVIFEYNANKTYIGFYYSNASTYTRTLGNETAYIKIRLQDTTNTLSNNTEIQVEYGNTKTSYVEHQEQTQVVSLGDIELCKIGNYVDTLEYDVDEDKVYKNKAIGKAIINGNSGTISRTATNRFNIDNVFTDYFKYVGSAFYLSNLYVAYQQRSINAEFDNLVSGVDYGFDLTSGTSYTIRIKDTRYDSVEDFQTSLNNNNLILYYALATATKEEITGTLKDQIKALYNSHSFNGTTNISSSGNLSAILGVSALKGSE